MPAAFWVQSGEFSPKTGKIKAGSSSGRTGYGIVGNNTVKKERQMTEGANEIQAS